MPYKKVVLAKFNPERIKAVLKKKGSKGINVKAEQDKKRRLKEWQKWWI